ncbi:30S RIBOSOMAL PROTEIN S9 [Mycoplasmopsis pulmonis]|uniref:Small ribosomal subunit protein uS9 n=1 Tax=Mycoplasmopsis pulmonis (strain UAB CTIP) TaxID=272635 RepID=RS9_MYCPU|nr:30S ribosomal protein S9 [Mycoplasmopsis pulmonis]Q98Q72.1 RecName: Full=Small ribosomal subunit protein uS9; AltName: Full=30S ribosomal protein S9 [Mycoplasmopsis pulmonis UAB CTIP]MDZ7293494.1 30S ribosomal protein S9 [Mycoplasmopsis pulmonis]CAC13669.1 30S RIBOSOMAL PROTEIN S9 [Mycoplasmopsis pulmonis]VEU68263.1 30S ribosomal protein S9 [Mycoplasmopsis pulmonis]
MAISYQLKSPAFRGLGRRKSSVARVILLKGSGKFTINKREAKEYLKSDIYIKDALQPFDLTQTNNTFDIRVTVRGGGLAGQAGAIRLGIARALLEISADYRSVLKEAKMLTRNTKVKERKKPGLRKARKARQFSKR